MNEKPTHLDLFSGIGGFALAAQWAGFRTIGFCEIEQRACETLTRHFPSIRNYGDVRTIPSIRCDLLTAGFPCQPFSIAGKQRGKDDDRYLWPSMLDAIERCKPSWLLAENVAGIRNVDFGQMLTELESRGYFVSALSIPACAVGAPHRRERVWIIANAAVDGREGIQRSVEAQIPQDRTPEALDAWNGTGDSFSQWSKLMAESDIRRMDDGISSELDVRPRLRSYGNAIVPQVAYEILWEIRKLI